MESTSYQKLTSDQIDKLTKAVVAASKEITTLEKDLTVGTGQSSYKAISDRQVKESVRKAMQNHGLALVPHTVEAKTERRSYEVSYGQKTSMKNEVWVEYESTYMLMHESGQWKIIPGFGHGIDSQDKAAGKASTYALKYAMINIFQIPVGDDLDPDNSVGSKSSAPVQIQSKEKLLANSKSFESKVKPWIENHKDLGLNEIVKKLKEGYDVPPQTIGEIKKLL